MKGGDIEYLVVMDNFVDRCGLNQLNINKTKKLVIEFRNHLPVWTIKTTVTDIKAVYYLI